MSSLFFSEMWDKIGCPWTVHVSSRERLAVQSLNFRHAEDWSLKTLKHGREQSNHCQWFIRLQCTSVPTQLWRTLWNFWWVLFSMNLIVNISARKNWVWIHLSSSSYAEAYFQFRMVSIPLNLSYNMLWTWRTYHETLPYSIYWNVVSGGIWWRRRGSLEEEKPRNTQLRWIMRN